MIELIFGTKARIKFIKQLAKDIEYCAKLYLDQKNCLEFKTKKTGTSQVREQKKERNEGNILSSKLKMSINFRSKRGFQSI